MRGNFFEKKLGLSQPRNSFSAFMGAGGEAPWEKTSGSGFLLQKAAAFRLESRKSKPLFFSQGAAAPGPRFKTKRKKTLQQSNNITKDTDCRLLARTAPKSFPAPLQKTFHQAWLDAFPAAFYEREQGDSRELAGKSGCRAARVRGRAIHGLLMNRAKRLVIVRQARQESG
ncbi:MAG: hypothetical protein HQK81_11445 [Desulfovibrionaceae bacterium]|nr:hypothetical protein [Desulfovibrionaceae bacterium]MBF0514657.1 hypothetical protein [Desulfovibrionaceae bacterium]